jgi:hypothetical protein
LALLFVGESLIFLEERTGLGFGKGFCASLAVDCCGGFSIGGAAPGLWLLPVEALRLKSKAGEAALGAVEVVGKAVEGVGAGGKVKGGVVVCAWEGLKKVGGNGCVVGGIANVLAEPSLVSAAVDFDG